MNIEVTTKLKNLSLRTSRDPVVVVKITFLPRGSGNRNHVKRFANAFRQDPIMSPHIIKIVEGTTALHLHMPCKFDAWRALSERTRIAREQAEYDDAGQMTLPLPA